MSRCISRARLGFRRIRAPPAVGKIRRISSLRVVDLPAPFGPINPNTSPVFPCIFSPSSEVLFFRFKNPKGYSLVRFSISIAASGMSSLLASRDSQSIAQQKIVHGEKIQRRNQLRYGGLTNRNNPRAPPSFSTPPACLPPRRAPTPSQVSAVRLSFAT